MTPNLFKPHVAIFSPALRRVAMLLMTAIAFTMLSSCATTWPSPDPAKDEVASSVAAPISPSPAPSTDSAVAATVDTKVPASEASPAISAANPALSGAKVNPSNPVIPSTVIADTSRLYPGTGQFVRQQPASPAASKGPEEFTLNFESVDIRAVVQSILGDMLRESFSIHPQTTGNVTIRLSRAVPRVDLMPILESLLRQNGQVMIREDGIFKVMPAGLGTKGSLTPQLVTSPAQLPNGYSVQIVQLRFAGVRDMARILEPYAVEPQSSIRVDELRNLVILSGTQRELKHMLEVIDLFDVDYLAGYSIGLFPMQTDVKALSVDLDRIFGGVSAGGTPGAAGAAAAGVSPLAGIVRIVPIERLNGLLVITTQARYLDEAKKWIDRLDKGGGLAGGMRLHVYPVQNGRADKLAQLLTDIYGNRTGGGTGATLAPGARPATTNTTIIGAPNQGGAGQQGGAGGLGALITNLFQSSGTAVSKDTRIIADNDNNALLILASPSDYEVILSALRQLDVPRRQVMVEVLVAEVNLKDELSFGIEWFMKDPKNNTIGALRNTTGDGAILPRVPGIPAGTADLRSLIPTVRGLQLINAVGGDIRGVLQMLGTDGRARIEFAPKLLVLDNEKGIVNVGSRISINTGTSTGTGGNTVTTNQYIDTGVLLTVTPRINAGGRVTMEINQEVSSANRAVTGNNNPDIDNRKAQTTVNVASGETMVLAGLIREQRDYATAGVPFLSKIPFIGGLFGTQTRNTNRTELVVMITPTVITNNDEARAVTEELRKKLPGLESLIPVRGANKTPVVEVTEINR